MIEIIIVYVEINAIELWNKEEIVSTYYLESICFSCGKHLCFFGSQTAGKKKKKKKEAKLLIWETKSNAPEQLQVEQSYVNVTLLSSTPAVLCDRSVINDCAHRACNSCCAECKSLQSCPTLYDSKDCGLSGSSVHGIFQAKILKCAGISFSRGSSRPRDGTRISCAGRWILYH